MLNMVGLNMQESMSIKHSTHKESVITKPDTENLSFWLSLVAENKDKQAFTHLFTYFAPKIKHFGLSKLDNEASANELVQETMTLIWKKSHLYHADKGAATTWVYTIMRNACFDMFRKVKSRAEQNLSDDIWPIDEMHYESEKNDNNFKDHLMSKQMLGFLEALPLAQKNVVKGLYYQELTQEQLANQLGVPIGTIKSRLRLALAKLKQLMGDQYND